MKYLQDELSELDLKKRYVESTETFEQHLIDLSDTRSFAEHLAQAINAPITIALNGTLGAGKTQLTRFLCEALGVPADQVTSPTYVLLQRYRGLSFQVYHFDFCRLENAMQVWDLGFDELQESLAILLVEWADKFPECLPPNRLEIELTVEPSTSKTARFVRVAGVGSVGRQICARLVESYR